MYPRRSRASSWKEASSVTAYGSVAGNTRGIFTPRAAHDFPLYQLPSTAPRRTEQKAIYAPEAPLQHFTRSGLVLTAALPSLGTGLDDRLGPRVLVQRWQIRGHLDAPHFYATNDYLRTIVDMFVVYDRSPNGAVATPGTMFELGAADGGIFQRADLRDRFKLLYRFRYVLFGSQRWGVPNVYTTLNGDRSTQLLDLDLSINEEVVFTDSSTTGLPPAVTRGLLYLVLFSSQPPGVAEYIPTVGYNQRVLFSDL